MIASRRRVLARLAVPLWTLAMAAILLWPITASGYLLGHDMVFTPRQPLDLASIGVSSASPRAVPLDALVALAERVVDGAVVGRIALLVPVIAAGLGAAALLGTRSVPARLAAAGVAVWNPYVTERLALGQWALLWCYAALPWIVLSVVRARGRLRWPARGVAIAAASITPTGGVIAFVSAVAICVGLRRGRRETLTVAGLALAMQLPWLVPALVSTAAATSDPAGVAAFAARAEHPGGVLLSLLGGGGIWDADVVPGSRGGALAWVWLTVLVAATVLGAPRLIQSLGGRLAGTLAALAACGLLVAVLPSVPGGAALVRAAVAHLPGAGLLRDAQKWLLPLVLLEALLVGAAFGRVCAWCHRRWRPALTVLALALPILVLPDAAATLRPTLRPVHYPSDWHAVARAAHSGDALVLPFYSYRTYPWAPGRTSVLDPAPRLLTVPAVVQDRLAVSGKLMTGEDPRAAAVGRLLSSGADVAPGLRALGIRWVVLERDTPGQVPALDTLVPVHDGARVALYRVSGRVERHEPAPWRVIAVVTADVLALLALAVAAGGSAFARLRKRGGALL